MLLGYPALAALILTFPIAVWAAWSDLATMKIPNRSVLALAAVFLVAGPFLLPWSAYFWGLAIMAITLVIGFVLSSIGMVGAGDAKFVATMSPFFVGAEVVPLMFLIASCMIVTLVLHRLAKRVAPLRAATPNWESWSTARYFPFGVALATILVVYLAQIAMIRP